MRIGQRITNPAFGDSITFREVPGPGAPRLVADLETEPGGSGPPAHIHPHTTEEFAVQRGRLGLELRGRRRVLDAGEVEVVPAGVPHKFFSAGDEPALTRVTFEHGGRMGEFLETMYELASAGRLDARGMPAPLQLAATCWEFRDDVRAAGVPWPVQRVLFAALQPPTRLAGTQGAYLQGELTRAGAAAATA